MNQPPFQNYHVGPEHVGLALIAVLRQLLPGQSWSKCRRLIHNRHVQINGTLCVDEGRRIAAGDVIKLWREPRQRPPRPEDVRIRYIDRHIIIVEKPAGITTTRHAEERNWPERRRQLQPTLDEMLRQILLRRSNQGQKSGQKKRAGARKHRYPFLRAVHRLDRETSGLMVFARSPLAQRRLVQMFRKHMVERVYLALVNGYVTEQTFDTYLVRDRGDGLRGSTDTPALGKRAITHVKPIEYLPGYTLLECRLETGRTHQIRIHLAEAGHPVCGEKLYCRRRNAPPLVDHSGAQRHALHAAVLGLPHPITGQPLRFTMPLPPDLQRLLRRLRDEAPRQ